MIERITIGSAPRTGAEGGSCCGGSGCAPGSTSAAQTPVDASVTAYQVEGMTCGHCVAAVRGELLQVRGVLGVDVDLVAGGVSTVTVTTQQAPADTAVRAAVEEAGYRLLDTGSSS